jgi:hypothetical protein
VPGVGALRPLAPAEIEAYRADGAVLLRRVIGADWVERMAAAVDRVLAKPSVLRLRHEFRDEARRAGRFFEAEFLWLDDPEFRALALDSPHAEIAAQAMASTTYFYDQLRHPIQLCRSPATIQPAEAA